MNRLIKSKVWLDVVSFICGLAWNPPPHKATEGQVESRTNLVVPEVYVLALRCRLYGTSQGPLTYFESSRNKLALCKLSRRGVHKNEVIIR